MNYFLGGFLFAGWMVLFILFAWNPKYSASLNVVYGLLSFVVIGALYLVPAWLIFYVK